MMDQIDGIPIIQSSFAPELINSRFVYSSSTVIVQTGVIDTVKSTEVLFKAISGLHLEWREKNPHQKITLRFMALLAYLPKDEWDLITAQDVLMNWFQSHKQFPGQYTSLNLPIEHFYQPKNLQPDSEFFLKAAAKLTDSLNVTGWGAYCKWINEEMNLILESISLESLDSYSLEAQFKNFNHEVDSQLLRNLEKEVQEILLKIGGLYQLFEYPSEFSETMLSLEKKLIKARLEIKRLLKFQYDTLEEVQKIILSIEKSHPTYVLFRHKIFIFSSLIKNHLEINKVKTPDIYQELMLLQLLNEELGVLTIISSDKGFDRPRLGVAIMLTISILKQKTSLEKLINFVLNWNQTAKEINRKIAQFGHEKFIQLIFNSSGDKDEVAFKHSGRLMIKFRYIFLEIIEKLCLSQAWPSSGEDHLAWVESQQVNKEYSLLLPVYKDAKTKLVILDEEGSAIGLTKAGHAIMTQLKGKV